MKNNFQTIKIWKTTYKLLKILAAHRNEKMVVVLHGLIIREIIELEIDTTSNINKDKGGS